MTTVELSITFPQAVRLAEETLGTMIKMEQVCGNSDVLSVIFAYSSFVITVSSKE